MKRSIVVRSKHEENIIYSRFSLGYAGIKAEPVCRISSQCSKVMSL